MTKRSRPKEKAKGVIKPAIDYAAAYTNNNIALVAWHCTNKIPNCLGFSIIRIDVETGTETVLPAKYPFKGQSNKNWTAKNTTIWPVQRFKWRDVKPPQERRLRYRIVPVFGTADQTVPDLSMAVETNECIVTAKRGSIFEAYFNNGFIAEQMLGHQLPVDQNGRPLVAAIEKAIADANSPVRKQLSGGIDKALMKLPLMALNEGGTLYLSLYELTDEVMISFILELHAKGVKIVLILANAGDNDSENAPARKRLHDAGIEVYDRIVPKGHIGHNKAAVYVNAKGIAVAVLGGSTNWTAHGICSQVNNALIIYHEGVAQAYLEYFLRLIDDTVNFGSKQGKKLRQANHRPFQFVTEDGVRITIFFSPNTPSTSRKTGELPIDLKFVFGLMNNIQRAFFFNVFKPGKPSIVDEIHDILAVRPDLVVRGAVNDPTSLPEGYALVFRRNGEDPLVVDARGNKDTSGLLTEERDGIGFARVHNKHGTGDPLGEDPISAGPEGEVPFLVDSSHNLGERASTFNDENMMVIEGCRDLTIAFMVNEIDVVDHFLDRNVIATQGHPKFVGFLEVDDTWQDDYFVAGSPKANETAYLAGVPTARVPKGLVRVDDVPVPIKTKAARRRSPAGSGAPKKRPTSRKKKAA